MSVPPDPVNIRHAVPDDATALAHLHVDCWDDAYTGLMAQEILDDRRAKVDERAVRWREILEAHDRTVLADAPEGLIGFAGAGPSIDEEAAAPGIDLQLHALYVRAAWWGTGLGYALMREAIGNQAAYLWVLANNERAIAFYERQGFRRDGTTDMHLEGIHARMVRAGT